MKQHDAPYKCHVFICSNSRGGERKSCGDGGSGVMKDVLKDEVKKRGWKGAVRVSGSGCLGVCEEGPNVMIYPQKIWFSEVKLDDIENILQTVKELLDQQG